MRIAYLSTYPPTPCGVAEYTRYLSESMLLTGNVEITIFSDRNYKENLEKDKTIEVIPCFDGGISDYDELIVAIKNYGPFDIIHVQHEYGIFPRSKDFLKLINLMKKYAKAIVITPHTVLHYSHPQGAVMYQRRMLRMFDIVIAHSSLQEFEISMQGVPYSSVMKIPHGTKINSYVGKISREQLVNHFGIEDKGEFLITTAGFLRYDKGLDVLVRALDIVRKSYDVRLVVVGIEQGKYGRGVMDTIKIDGKIPDYVSVIRRYPDREELEMLLATSDLIVLPYKDRPRRYAVSGAFHLALGSFKPIIGTKVPRLIELYEIAPELVVAPGKHEELAAKIIDFIENTDDYVTYLKMLKEYAIYTSWEKVALRHINVYKSIIEKKARKSFGW